MERSNTGTVLSTSERAFDHGRQPDHVAEEGDPCTVAKEGAGAVDDRTNIVKADRVNMLERWAEESDGTNVTIDLVRLSQDETPVIPFTTDGSLVKLHYCDDPETRSYVHCNGNGCLLCRIGRNQDERLLLPVYVVTTRSIAVLPISPTSRPGALRPQIMPILRSGRRVAMLIRRIDRVAFRVGTVELQDGMDDGAEVIADFVARWGAGQVDLTTVYPRLDNHDLAGLAGVAALMQFKRIEA
jgi:hypothetical protein